MTSSRAYLLRALHEWICDNNKTPYIVIDAENPESIVPKDLAKNGTIVFNITAQAVGQLLMDNDHVEFDASFGGVVQHIYAPIEAILAIYAQENGLGMMFAETTIPGEEKGFKKTPKKIETKPVDKKPKLRIVKDSDDK